ncbi:hypothetical protein ERO13_D01G142066v2 [Gossypium hirsutum]|uniref:Uncharacterized protein n=1 Tax=Gossypium tomentosum TaxID=34277 RepID=A0A5D2MAQ1_GOSTO|nr:hypothetical protein ERO13_D01G142066v2 [Gossypium hirsutum]TYH88383.1 hypothetical protein ES332_D01G184500v1 [Gossypium tomentosum]
MHTRLVADAIRWVHEDWITRNVADVVCMFALQVDELIQSLSSAKDILPLHITFMIFQLFIYVFIWDDEYITCFRKG